MKCHVLNSDNESLNAESIVGPEPSHQGLDPSDAHGVARINLFSDVGCDINSLDVGNDFRSDLVYSKLRSRTLLETSACNSDLLDVCDDISFRIEQNMVDDPIDLGNDNVPSILHGMVSSERR